MIYQSAFEAISLLMLDNDNRVDTVRLVFNLSSNTVTHCGYAKEAQEQHNLDPTEYAVETEVFFSTMPYVMAKTTALVAIHHLRSQVQLTDEEIGSVPPMLDATMFHYTDYGAPKLVPYDEDVMGFVHEGHQIRNPMLSACGKYQVDPVGTFGFTKLDNGKSTTFERPLEDGGKMRLHWTETEFTLERYSAEGRRIAYAHKEQFPTADSYPEPAMDTHPSPGM